MSEKITIPLLNNNNYSTWKVRMQMLLIRDDYWFVIEEPTPDLVPNSWKRENQKALETIVLFLSDNQMHLVKDVTTAKVWLKLKAYHESETMTSRVFLLKRICNLNMTEGQEISNICSS